MNAPTKFPLDVEPAAPLGKSDIAHLGPTPADLEITVRDARFGREQKPGRWWLGGDPIGTAWHNALSATFPRGEAMFIEALRLAQSEQFVPSRAAIDSDTGIGALLNKLWNAWDDVANHPELPATRQAAMAPGFASKL